MNKLYVVYGPRSRHIQSVDDWSKAVEYIKDHCYEVDVYSNEGYEHSYKIEGGHLMREPGPLWPGNTPRISGPKYRVVWRKSGEYVEFDNEEEAEEWGKQNLEFFDIFHEPAVYVITWKYDYGYNEWHSSYAPKLAISNPKKPVFKKFGLVGYDFSGQDSEDESSGKEYSVEYIYDNGESERDYGGKSLNEARDDVEYMIENYDNLVSWKIHGPDDEVVFQGNEFSGSDSPVGISGHENAVRNFRQLRSYIAENRAGEVELLIAWEKLTQRLIQ